MATNCDSCGHRTNEVSWKEAVLFCAFIPELPVQLLGGKLDLRALSGAALCWVVKPLSQVWSGLWDEPC